MNEPQGSNNPDKSGDHEGVENLLGEFETILGHQIREKILGGIRRKSQSSIRTWQKQSRN